MLHRDTVIWFGPVQAQPSWWWVGADIAAHLANDRPVHVFHELDDVPDGAIVFWIKQPGSDEIAQAIRRKRLIVLFFPVDCFLDPAHIRTHREFIRAARLVCLHASSLATYFPGSAIAAVDHYNKYGVRHQDRTPGDAFLWIGAFQYVPYVLDGLAMHAGRSRPVVLMTNYNCERAKDAAQRNASRMGLNDFERRLSDSGVELRMWSEASQRAALLSCRAAFDFKYMDCFNQRTKPPTKLQKYLCSGIPCSVNADFPLPEPLGQAVLTLTQLDAQVDEPAMRATLASYSEVMSARLALPKVADHYLKLAKRALMRPM